MTDTAKELPPMTPVREALERLLTTAKLLQQNAVGCATNHYGHDCELNGLPGWLIDTQKDIIAAQESLSAAPGEPCAVKPLEWRDHRPDSFPEPAWSAQTPFGFYNIEEVSASDSPAYVVRLHAHHFIADKDGLDEAKAAAQADYERRIRSALVTTPQPAAGWDEARRGIYIASKTKHADRWRRLRDELACLDVPVISTWIDEAGEGESADLDDLWRRCVHEASHCRVLIVYREHDDVLKGGWVEVGAALAVGVPVYAVGLDGFTIAKYRGITHFSDMATAVAAAVKALRREAPAPAEVTYKIGRWLSAALDDPQVCAEMKADIIAWMDAGQPNVQPTARPDTAEARLRAEDGGSDV